MAGALVSCEAASEMKAKGRGTPDRIEKATGGGRPGLAPFPAKGGFLRAWVKLRRVSPLLDVSGGKSLLK